MIYVLMGTILLFVICFAVFELSSPYTIMDDEDFRKSFVGTLIRRFTEPFE